jgi:hypothetical protein
MKQDSYDKDLHLVNPDNPVKLVENTTINMKTTRFLPLSLILTCTVIAKAQEPAPTPKHNLMPVPTSIKFHRERLAVDANFRVATRGHSDARLQAGIWRFIKRLEGRTVLTMPPALAQDDQVTPLIIHCQGPGKNIPSVSEDESYRIDITNRQAILSAPTVVGATGTTFPACRSTINHAFLGAD